MTGILAGGGCSHPVSLINSPTPCDSVTRYQIESLRTYSPTMSESTDSLSFFEWPNDSWVYTNQKNQTQRTPCWPDCLIGSCTCRSKLDMKLGRLCCFWKKQYAVRGVHEALEEYADRTGEYAVQAKFCRHCKQYHFKKIVATGAR